MNCGETANNGRMVRNIYFYLCLFLFFIVFVAGYYDVFQWMYGRYIGEDSYYSHGFLIPFVTGYLIWLKKEELTQVPPEGSLSGLYLIVFAIIIHLFGVAVYVFSVSAFSIGILVFGISLFLYGKAVTKTILFPLAFLFFMFPLPLSIINTISFPLKMFVAHLGVKIVALFGVPIFREGFNIFIPQGQMLVGNPCSGLRSLISLLALGSVFAYISDLSSRKKILLFLLTIPVAIVSNLVRVNILILCSHRWGLESAAPGTLVHTGSGLFVFVLSVFLLFAFMNWLKDSHEK